MTCQDSADSIVKGIAGPRGNRGANRGKSYSRMPADGGASGRFAEALTAAMDAAGVPQCFSKFSNCIYTDRQKLAVLVLMARHGISYGAVRRDLGMYRGFTDAIGLKRIPDGSTLCKFLKRIGTDVLERVVMAFAAAADGGATVAVDSTGLSDFDRSAHYEKRLDDFGAGRSRSFTKLSLAVDTGTRIVLSASASADGHRNDTTFMPGHISDLAGSGLKIDWLIADRAYDSSLNHRLARDVLGARAAIPVRRGRGNRGTVIHGPYRRMMDEALSDPDSAESRAYRRRAVIESTNFMIKKAAGPSVSARIPACRERQALLKAIAFNALRVIRLGRIDRLRGGFQ
ncbi:transposase [Methanomassiliicoccales archaeon LGM-DZ1]|nr:transposase [Methanomassiliicoccales archaeon LGM-DZ1]